MIETSRYGITPNIFLISESYINSNIVNEIDVTPENANKINDTNHTNLQNYSSPVTQKNSQKINHLKNLAISALIFTLLWVFFIIIGMVAVFVPGFGVKSSTGWILTGISILFFIVANILMLIIKFGFCKNNETGAVDILDGGFEFVLDICGFVVMGSIIGWLIDFFMGGDFDGLWMVIWILIGVVLILVTIAITFAISVITLTIGSLIINSKLIHEENKIMNYK